MGTESTDKITITDRIIAAAVLPFIPKIVTPNHITAFRFAMTPFVLYFLSISEYGWGLSLFVVTALSDAVDGALARTRGPITDWGKMYDPLADKILIGTVAALVVSRFLNQWIALTIIALELSLIVSAFWLRRYRNVEIKAKKVGKIKMILQSFGVGFLLLAMVTGFEPLIEVARYTLYVAIMFAVASLVVYHSI